MLKYLATALLILLVTSIASAAPMQYRIWQFQAYDMDHIKRLIDMAAEQQVNRIQLSHLIVMDVEEPLGKPHLVKDINTICGWAHAKGIKVDMWTHELNGIPKELQKDGKADLDDPKLWEFVKGKYDKLFKLCPDLDGLVLTLHETAMSIWDERKVVGSSSPEDRVAKLIDDLYEVCNSFDKTFFIRTFSYEPNQLQYIKEGIKRCKTDPIVMSKCCPHDWQPYYPFNPAIGNVGGKKQIVEFDLGHEFTGLSTIPYINIEYMHKHLKYGISKGISGAVYRVERHDWLAVDTPNQAVIDVFTKFLLDTTQDPKTLYKQWLAERYPADAVPYLYSAFMRTEPIVDKGLYVLGFWVTNHSRLPDYGYAMKSLRGRTTAKWDPDTKPIEQELYNPTPETMKKIAEEKDAALRLVEKSIDDIKSAKPYLKQEDYDNLLDLFEREKAMVVVWKAAMEVMFGINVYKSTKAESDAKFLTEAADRLDKLAEENREHLIRMLADFRKPRPTGNADAAHGLARLARETLQTVK